MVDEIINNLHLINAPAGSGKTTFIYNKISSILYSNVDANILCITYTNRAVDELKNRLVDFNSNKLEIFTIHSFLNNFFSIFFSNNKVIELYFQIYGDEIKRRIDNVENNDNYAESNKKYIEKSGSLSYEKIKSSINKIKYNETSFNSLYYGGLSHDDLITFTKKIIEEFPIIKKKISKKYDYIFIDEYQDTSADVLKMFYNCILNTKTQLFLLGDKMQQIYKTYDGTFEEELSSFDKSTNLKTNYRSTEKIVDLLNNLYNEKDYSQTVSDQNRLKESINPICIFSDNIDETIKLNMTDDCLTLYIFNQEKYESIGSGNLFTQVTRMEKYSFISKYDASDAFNNKFEDNVDTLFKALYIVYYINDLYNTNNIGGIISTINKYNKIFDKKQFEIKYLNEKNKIKDILDIISKNIYNTEISINDFINLISIINKDYLDIIISDDDYKDVLEVKLIEFTRIYNYFLNIKCSTQHGVKGESHNNVLFIAEDSSNPSIKMYDFFRFLTYNDVKYSEFEKFYYSYKTVINTFESDNKIKISELNSELYNANEQKLVELANNVKTKFSSSIYYSLIKNDVDNYLIKKKVTLFKNALKVNNIFGVISAYKLFYVGCSRARYKLILIIDNSKIQDFKIDFSKKLIKLGFEIKEKDDKANS